jgi:hypothetical protein
MREFSEDFFDERFPEELSMNRNEKGAVYQPGKPYMKQFGDVFKKIEIINIFIKTSETDDGYGTETYIAYAVVKNGKLGGTKYEKLESNSFFARRINHCWVDGCKKVLDEEVMDYCKKCGWIICPHDRACSIGCPNNHKAADNKIPDWYKSYDVPEDIKKTVYVEFYSPKNAQKENIIIYLGIVMDHTEEFLFEGFYDEKSDCVSIEPTNTKRFRIGKGEIKKCFPLDMSDDLHAYVLQAFDDIMIENNE